MKPFVPPAVHTKQIGGERGRWWVRRGEREGTGDAHRLTSALLLTDLPLRRRICLSPARFFDLAETTHLSPIRFRSRRQTPISLCQAMCRSLVRPSDLDARSRAPHRSWGALAFTSDHPPPIHPFSLRLSLRESSSRSCEKVVLRPGLRSDDGSTPSYASHELACLAVHMPIRTT